MLLLAFDTATPRTTVAVHDGERVRASAVHDDAMRHGEVLAPLIERVLADAGASPRDLTEIVVGAGPGPFTGLRAGLVTARTLGHVLSVPVHGVCTLDILAAAAEETPSSFLVATDARRKEVYWARYASKKPYTSKEVERVDGPHVSKPYDIAAMNPADLVVGRGARLYPEAFPNAAGPDDPDAAVLADLVVRQAIEPLDPVPLYLRRPDVAVPGAPKKVSA